MKALPHVHRMRVVKLAPPYCTHASMSLGSSYNCVAEGVLFHGRKWKLCTGISLAKKRITMKGKEHMYCTRWTSWNSYECNILGDKHLETLEQNYNNNTFVSTPRLKIIEFIKYILWNIQRTSISSLFLFGRFIIITKQWQSQYIIEVRQRQRSSLFLGG